MGDIFSDIKSKAEAAAICCCLCRCDIKPTTRFAGLHYRSARTTAQLRRNAKVLALRKRLRKSGYREGRKASATAQLLTTAQLRRNAKVLALALRCRAARSHLLAPEGPIGLTVRGKWLPTALQVLQVLQVL